VIDGEKILITGATGKIAFPIARALAKRNEVWGAARLSKPGDGDRLAAAGVRALRLDMSTGDFSGVPDDFTYVFHAAVDPGAGDWRRCVLTNADHSGKLMHHCRKAKGFVYCSTGSIYKYQGHRPLTEADGPGELQLFENRGRGGLHLGRRALQSSAHHHPHLLDLRTFGRRARRSAGADIAAEADTASPR